MEALPLKQYVYLIAHNIKNSNKNGVVQVAMLDLARATFLFSFCANKIYVFVLMHDYDFIFHTIKSCKILKTKVQ